MANKRQSYVYLDENDEGLVRGASHPWEDIFCIHMAASTAPTVAPVAQDVELHAAAGVTQAVRIGSYAGSVIRAPLGELFGAICGIDQSSKPGDERLTQAAPLRQLLASCCPWSWRLTAPGSSWPASRSRPSWLRRPPPSPGGMTGANGTAAWMRGEARFARFGDPMVLAISTSTSSRSSTTRRGTPPATTTSAAPAQALCASVRAEDGVARLGGDEFGVLLRSCDEAAAVGRVQETNRAHEAGGVAGSVGWAPITVLRGFPRRWLRLTMRSTRPSARAACCA